MVECLINLQGVSSSNLHLPGYINSKLIVEKMQAVLERLLSVHSSMYGMYLKSTKIEPSLELEKLRL